MVRKNSSRLEEKALERNRPKIGRSMHRADNSICISTGQSENTLSYTGHQVIPRTSKAHSVNYESELALDLVAIRKLKRMSEFFFFKTSSGNLILCWNNTQLTIQRYTTNPGLKIKIAMSDI